MNPPKSHNTKAKKLIAKPINPEEINRTGINGQTKIGGEKHRDPFKPTEEEIWANIPIDLG